MNEVILELIKYTLPSLVVLATAYLVLRNMLKQDVALRHLELKMGKMRDTMPVRLQAYERITLFLERISIHSLLNRVRKQDMNSREFQIALLSAIRSEYEHNITQQIYVSPEIWAMTRAAKEEVITIINKVAQTIPPNVPSIELSKKILTYLIESEMPSPPDKVLQKIKEEVSELF